MITIKQYDEARDFDNIISSCQKEGWVKFYTTKKEQYRACLPLSHTYVAYQGQQYCGYARFLTDGHFSIYCCEIIIDAHYRRQAMATKLIEHMRTLYPTCSIDVISDNDAFYQSNGFFIVGNGLRRP